MIPLRVPDKTAQEVVFHLAADLPLTHCAAATRHHKGPLGGLARWVFVRVLWYVEQRAVRRGVSLKRTQRRLDEKLQEIIRAANCQERLRRATHVTDWVLQGLVVSREVAQEICDYEARPPGQKTNSGPGMVAAPARPFSAAFFPALNCSRLRLRHEQRAA